MKFPDFIFIGTQKSATTSMYKYLCQHPQVVPNNYKKEVKFWNYVYDKGIDWYKNCFPNVEAKITGEVTSNYFWYVNPITMYKDLPKTTKLAVIFRNPIDRMYSFYWWLKRCPCEKHPIKDTFEKSYELFLRESVYVNNLVHWVHCFGWSRIHIIILEEFIQNPKLVWMQLCQYLNIEDIPLTKTTKYLQQRYPPMSQKLRNKLIKDLQYSNQLFFDYIRKPNYWKEGCV